MSPDDPGSLAASDLRVIAGSDFNMNTFQWLLVLGFPVNIAAAQSMPELFSADDMRNAEAEEQDRLRRLQVDRAVTHIGRRA